MMERRWPPSSPLNFNTSASITKDSDDVLPLKPGDAPLELSKIPSQNLNLGQRDASSDRRVDNSLPVTIELDNTTTAKGITQTERIDHTHDAQNECDSERAAYPSGFDLVVLTIALMSSVFMIALDTNIIGRLDKTCA